MKVQSKMLLSLVFLFTSFNSLLANAPESTEPLWDYKTILGIIVVTVFTIGIVLYLKEKKENERKYGKEIAS